MAAAVKKPGRPPKKQSVGKSKIQGIQLTPTQLENQVEFEINDASVFKSLFTYFKNMKTEEIHMKFDPTSIMFFARDKNKISKTMAKINCNLVNLYYCQDTYYITINRASVEKVFSTIGKSTSKLSIIKSIEYPNDIVFTFEDKSIGKETTYKINTLKKDIDDDDLMRTELSVTPDELAKYPIKFTFSDKNFKKVVEDISKNFEILSIQKNGEKSLQLTASKEDIQFVEIYNSTEDINLDSQIGESIFDAKIKISNVIPLAKSMVSESIRIICRENSDFIFASALDNTPLSIYTIIKNS